ncbi:TetR family transcriptional regulator [Mycobacterium avium subsp. hominissuis 10-5606]|nr:TetR family transcriptional regulator [Mycobacterium avium subsp. hominissuis 10-5606]
MGYAVGVSAGTSDVGQQLRSDAQLNLERIVSSARRLFAQRGLDATLSDIADGAGVGVGTVYRRFATKEELIGHIFASRLRDVVELAERAVAMSSPWDGLVLFLQDSARMMAEDHGLRDLLVGSQGPASVGLTRSAVASARATVNRLTADLVERAKQTGDLRDDFEATDLYILAMSVQAVAQLTRHQSPDLWRRVLGVSVDGLRRTRDRPSSLPVPPLTVAELDRAVDGLDSAPAGSTRRGPLMK